MQHTRKESILCTISWKAFLGFRIFNISFYLYTKKYPDRRARGWNRSKDEIFLSCIFTGVISRGQSGRGVKFPQSSFDFKNEWVSDVIPLLPKMPSWHGYGKTLISHNKQIPWTMSYRKCGYRRHRKFTYMQTQELNFRLWAENWQWAFRK